MQVILEMALAFFVLFGLWNYSELRMRRLKDRQNFVFTFPRRPAPSWTTTDDTLARLCYDYGLSDGEVERLVREGIREAAQQYRKQHPLDGPPPSDELYETVFPVE